MPEFSPVMTATLRLIAILKRVRPSLEFSLEAICAQHAESVNFGTSHIRLRTAIVFAPRQLFNLTFPHHIYSFHAFESSLRRLTKKEK